MRSIFFGFPKKLTQDWLESFVYDREGAIEGMLQGARLYSLALFRSDEPYLACTHFLSFIIGREKGSQSTEWKELSRLAAVTPCFVNGFDVIPKIKA